MKGEIELDGFPKEIIMTAKSYRLDYERAIEIIRKSREQLKNESSNLSTPIFEVG